MVLNKTLKHIFHLVKSAILFGVLIQFISCKESTSLPDPLEAGWKGEQVCEILSENDEIRILKCTFPPNIGHEKHEHAPHLGYTLKGSRFRLVDETGTREVDVPTGYLFEKKEVTVHEIVNIGDSTAVFLIIEPK